MDPGELVLENETRRVLADVLQKVDEFAVLQTASLREMAHTRLRQAQLAAYPLPRTLPQAVAHV